MFFNHSVIVAFPPHSNITWTGNMEDQPNKLKFYTSKEKEDVHAEKEMHMSYNNLRKLGY